MGAPPLLPRMPPAGTPAKPAIPSRQSLCFRRRQGHAARSRRRRPRHRQPSRRPWRRLEKLESADICLTNVREAQLAEQPGSAIVSQRAKQPRLLWQRQRERLNMGGLSIWHWLIFLVVALLLFG